MYWTRPQIRPSPSSANSVSPPLAAAATDIVDGAWDSALANTSHADQLVLLGAVCQRCHITPVPSTPNTSIRPFPLVFAAIVDSAVANSDQFDHVSEPAVTCVRVHTYCWLSAANSVIRPSALRVAAVEVTMTWQQYRSRSGEPGPPLVTTPVVADSTSRSRTFRGVSDGFWASTMAAAPTTWGVA